MLALLDEKTKVLELLNETESDPDRGLPHKELATLLEKQEINITEVKIETRSSASNDGQDLYRVVDRKPLVKLLPKAGAPYCDEYVREYLTSEEAGRYCVAFAVPERATDLAAMVEKLPSACKRSFSITRSLGTLSSAMIVSPPSQPPLPSSPKNHSLSQVPLIQSPGYGFTASSLLSSSIQYAGSAAHEYTSAIEKQEATKGIPYADELLEKVAAPRHCANEEDEKETINLLKSIPTATPRSLHDIVQLMKWLRSVFISPNATDTTKDHTVDWERLLMNIEPYLYGGTPMCEALRSVEPLSKNQHTLRRS